MNNPIVAGFTGERQHEFRYSASVDLCCQEQEWEITTFIGMFRPGQTMTLRASSQFEAECIAQQSLSTDEWFPSFSARRI